MEVYRERQGRRRAPRRPPRPWSRFQPRKRTNDPSTRHDPATAISDEARWSDHVDEPIPTILVLFWLFLAGLVETIGYYAFTLLRIVSGRRSAIVVERDGEIIERYEVAGWLESVRLIHHLRARYKSIDR